MTARIKNITLQIWKRGLAALCLALLLVGQVGAAVAQENEPVKLVRIDVDRVEQLAPLAEMKIEIVAQIGTDDGRFCNGRPG